MTENVDWRTEIIASLTVWAVLVPSALAYSGIVGVDPMIGLLGVPLALAGYFIAGSNSALIVGADAALSALAGSALIGLASGADSGEALVTLSLLVAVIFLLLRFLRMGWVADLIPQPVLKGFIQGLVWVTIAGQIPKLLGLTIDDPASSFGGKLADIVTNLNTMHGPTALIGLVSVVALFGLSAVQPRLPAALIQLLFTGIAVAVFNLADDGVSVVGEPTGGLFGSLALPTDPDLAISLLPAAAAIVIVGFTESLGASSMVSETDGAPVRPNRELLGLGAANLGVALGGCYPVTGARSNTAVAVRTGGRTRLTAAGVAVLAVLTILFLRPLLNYLADAALAAGVIWAMAGMVDISYLQRLYRISREQFIVSTVAFVGVLAFGVMPAVGLAYLLSLAILARHVSRPPMSELTMDHNGRWHDVETTEDYAPDGFAALRIDGPVVFVNARNTADTLQDLIDSEDVNTFDIDASAITAVDTTAIYSLDALRRRMMNRGKDLWLAAPDERVFDRLKALTDGDLLPVYDSLDEAVAAYTSSSQRTQQPGTA